MLLIMERPNAILKSEFVNIYAYLISHISLKKGKDFKLKIMESLLIARDKPIFNKADSSLPLELL